MRRYQIQARNKQMINATHIQMEASRKHTLKCIKLAKTDILNRLLFEIAREDYQTVSQVKESINGFLIRINEEGEG
tara:strand:- start:9313 stop:9540 length:228 start_codon:yes stop_codon:yes gene_type:complete